MEQEQNATTRTKVAGLLTDRLKEVWGNFMEEFQQSFDLNQLDLVFSVLKELESSSQNPMKKKRTQVMQREDESQENNNNHQSSLEKKVFGNHLLAKSVFMFLPNKDLFSCRLMNSYCNEYATERLVKRDLKIKFTRRTSTNRFYLKEEGDNATVSNWRTLDMLTELLRTSKQFPCSKFLFDGGNLGNDDAQRFFSFYGSSIKSIEISLCDENRDEDADKSEDGFSVAVTESRILGMILSQQLPNLEHFNLNLFHNEEDDWAGFHSLLFPSDKQIVLPNLKTVIYNARASDQDFLRQLLNATINLQTFEFEGEYFVMDYLDLFIETGKIKTIYDLSFSPTNHLNELEKMVEYGPELKCLNLNGLSRVYKNPELWGKVSTVLSKFLASSQISLNGFYLYSLGFLRQLQLPILENVKELNLKIINDSSFNPEDIHDYSFAFLPRGVTFSRNFPQLHSITFSFESEISSDDAAAWWKKCFPTDEIVPTVKKLDVSEYPRHCCPLLWIEKFGTIFPNLESLSVKNIKDFPNFSKIIWTNYTKLTSLDVYIDDSLSLNSRPFILDSSFTGISPETCKTLEKRSLSALERIGDNFRDNPSILNLKDLQTLDITFQANLGQDCTNFMTRLTGPCAFNLLENLKSVNISVCGVQNQNVLSRIKKSMEPLRAYKVNIK